MTSAVTDVMAIVLHSVGPMQFMCASEGASIVL